MIQWNSQRLQTEAEGFLEVEGSVVVILRLGWRMGYCLRREHHLVPAPGCEEMN